MVATRSSPQSDSSSPASPCQTEPVLGDKRKAGASLTQNSKAGQNGAEKKQKTLEETIGQFGNDYRHNQDRDASKHYDGSHASTATSQTRKELPVDSVKDDPEESQLGKSDNVDISGDTNNELKQKPSAKDGEVHEAVDATAREQTTPDSILEKGLIYFFFRGRVGIEDPSNTNEIARSYIVIRPIPHGASLKQASVDTNVPSYRVLALPKKVLPTTPRDRFMVFVDYAKITADEIKDNVLKSSDYATQTAGTRHQPSATPIASGVYAFTTTGRETHLAYMLTLTDGGPNEVQKDVGLREKGSFVVSVKNPQYEGPTGTNLPKGPDFPQEILDGFRSLRWAPLQSKMLDYQNMQMLLIGAHADDNDLTGIEPHKNEEGKDGPLQELGRLEGEDEIRVSALKDDVIFEDLALSHKEYSSMQTKW